ncbi:DUF5700 domain-containing putative Zn-dependent protease [Hymenobacter wooponensis]|uniref:DUF2268 domain-containing protein n=1 Tax=Hymenobacter wooponensis TaxID=1525360 RepID=A0A4Z0MF38_9BACT|nr:DUF5700 domain-containing putative Zn-dependent protease [Hymenobacter wooponensis]TGD78363.1 hypothetical protein EU557_19855 [Hymenobacter wooponensis]
MNNCPSIVLALAISFSRRLVGLFLCLLASTGAMAQSINTDAVTRFWQLTDELRQNRPIADKDWTEFINLPGNKTYIRNTFLPDPLSVYSLESYRKALETVYMPKNDSLRRIKLRDKVAPYVLANEYKEREAEYREYIQQTIQSPQYIALMYTLAYEYLPAASHTKVPDLKMYYTAIGDGATSQQEGIFYSLKAVVDHDKAKPGIVEAHEMHHQLVPTKDFGTVAPEDKGLFWALRGIRSEGIADLIDKTPMYQVPGDPHRVQAQFLTPAPRSIQRLDSLLQSVAKLGAPAKKPATYYQRILHSAGHVPGCYMARVIEANGYRKELIAHIDNPFAFVRLYQKAAQKDATHPPQFSKDTMNYLAAVEKAYSQPAPKKS